MNNQPHQFTMVADCTTDAKPHRRGHAPHGHPQHDQAPREHHRAPHVLKAKASDRNLSWYEWGTEGGFSGIAYEGKLGASGAHGGIHHRHAPTAPHPPHPLRDLEDSPSSGGTLGNTTSVQVLQLHALHPPQHAAPHPPPHPHHPPLYLIPPLPHPPSTSSPLYLIPPLPPDGVHGRMVCMLPRHRHSGLEGDELHPHGALYHLLRPPDPHVVTRMVVGTHCLVL